MEKQKSYDRDAQEIRENVQREVNKAARLAKISEKKNGRQPRSDIADNRTKEAFQLYIELGESGEEISMEKVSKVFGVCGTTISNDFKYRLPKLVDSEKLGRVRVLIKRNYLDGIRRAKKAWEEKNRKEIERKTIKAARCLRNNKSSISEVSEKLGISSTSVSRYINYGLPRIIEKLQKQLKFEIRSKVRKKIILKIISYQKLYSECRNILESNNSKDNKRVKNTALHFVEGLSRRKIAEALEVSPKIINDDLVLGLPKLKCELEEKIKNENNPEKKELLNAELQQISELLLKVNELLQKEKKPTKGVELIDRVLKGTRELIRRYFAGEDFNLDAVAKSLSISFACVQRDIYERLPKLGEAINLEILKGLDKETEERLQIELKALRRLCKQVKEISREARAEAGRKAMNKRWGKKKFIEEESI